MADKFIKTLIIGGSSYVIKDQSARSWINGNTITEGSTDSTITLVNENGTVTKSFWGAAKHPTTIAGYGIADASVAEGTAGAGSSNVAGTIILGSNTASFQAPLAISDKYDASTSKVIAKKDLDDAMAEISGAFVFRGIAKTNPEDGNVTQVIIGGETKSITVKVGDVVLYRTYPTIEGDTRYTEYVCTAVTSGTQTWQKIGDGKDYAVKGEIVDADIAANASIAQSKVNGLVGALADLENNKADKSNSLDGYGIEDAYITQSTEYDTITLGDKSVTISKLSNHGVDTSSKSVWVGDNTLTGILTSADTKLDDTNHVVYIGNATSGSSTSAVSVSGGEVKIGTYSAVKADSVNKTLNVGNVSNVVTSISSGSKQGIEVWSTEVSLSKGTGDSPYSLAIGTHSVTLPELSNSGSDDKFLNQQGDFVTIYAEVNSGSNANTVHLVYDAGVDTNLTTPGYFGVTKYTTGDSQGTADIRIGGESVTGIVTTDRYTTADVQKKLGINTTTGSQKKFLDEKGEFVEVSFAYDETSQALTLTMPQA